MAAPNHERGLSPKDYFIATMEESGGIHEKFENGTVIYEAGKPADALYVVTQGKIVTSRENEDREFMDVVAQPGMLVGIEAFDGDTYDNTAQSFKSSEAIRIDRDNIGAAVAAEPDLLLKLLSMQINYQESYVGVTKHGTAKSRIKIAAIELYGKGIQDSKEYDQGLLGMRAGINKDDVNRTVKGRRR